MVRVIILILTLVPLLLIEGFDSSQVDVKNGTATNSTRRILHGQTSDASNFRFMVKIVYRGTCSGAIIASNWILTACHCITNVPCIHINMYPAAWGPEEKVNPFQCYRYPHYSPSYHEHDIGMIKVEQDLLSDSRAGAIDLPPPGKHYPSGTKAVIAGWGDNENNETPGGLMRAEVELTSRDHCVTLYTAKNPDCKSVDKCGDRALPLRLICAVGMGSKPPGICYGDFGGPVIVEGKVIGVSAFIISSDGKCEAGTPSVFIRVVDYLPWIYSYLDPMKETGTFPVHPEHIIPI